MFLLTGASAALLMAAQTATSASSLPEIIVTARRLPEALSSVPISVTAFDAKTITSLGATSLDELARFTPGFSFNSAAGRGPNSNRPTVRGLTTIRNGIANSTVAATFIDGVYLGGSSQSTPLHDLERIEILRGPQSAQFGRATYAGAINYVTLKHRLSPSDGGWARARAQAAVAHRSTSHAEQMLDFKLHHANKSEFPWTSWLTGLVTPATPATPPHNPAQAA